MRISTKIRTLVLTVILLISSSILIVINIDLIQQNKEDIKNIRENEFNKAKGLLKNYVDIATEVILKQVEDSQNLEYLQTKYGNELINIIDSANSIIDNNIRQYNNGEIDLSTAKFNAMENIKSIRYAGGTGYIWINDTTAPIPKMIMHPTNPDLDNTILDNPDYNCALGSDENLFKAAVDITKKNGEGFIDYFWPKPKSKLSYVRLIEEWDWILGTGIYIDDAVEEAKKESLTTISSMRYDDGLGYFWINNNEEPIPKMVMHPISSSLNGEILDSEEYNKVKDTEANIFSEFVKVTKTDGEGYIEYSWPKPSADGTTTEEKPKLSFGRLIESWDWIIGTGFYIDEIDQTIAEKELELKARLLKLTLLTILIAVVIAIILIILTSFIIREIIKPLKHSTKILHEMSQGEGDLTNRLTAKHNDEIGELSKHFNNFMEKLSAIVTQIKISSSKNIEIKDQLFSSTTATTGDIKDINSRIASMQKKIVLLNTDISETDGNVNKIIRQVELLDNTIDDESAAIEESSAAINQMVASINSVSQITNSTHDLISGLLEKTKKGGYLIDKSTTLSGQVNEQMEEIKNITTIISGISAKTNLLGMNAAIEAAHAGDAGKGFAVVAEEIRKLSITTSKSIVSITDVIKNVSNNILVSSQSSMEAKDAFVLIDADVNMFARGLNEIATATSELTTGGKEILEALNLLNQVSLNVQDNSKEMAEMSDSMKISMKKANDVTAQVTEAISDIVISSDKIAAAISDMVEYNKNLADSANKLSSEISQFKTE